MDTNIEWGLLLKDRFHRVVARLLPDDRAALKGLPELMPPPVSSACAVPRTEIRRQVAGEFGERYHALRQLESLMHYGGSPTPTAGHSQPQRHPGCDCGRKAVPEGDAGRSRGRRVGHNHPLRQAGGTGLARPKGSRPFA